MDKYGIRIEVLNLFLDIKSSIAQDVNIIIIEVKFGKNTTKKKIRFQSSLRKEWGYAWGKTRKILKMYRIESSNM